MQSPDLPATNNEESNHLLGIREGTRQLPAQQPVKDCGCLEQRFKGVKTVPHLSRTAAGGGGWGWGWWGGVVAVS